MIGASRHLVALGVLAAIGACGDNRAAVPADAVDHDAASPDASAPDAFVDARQDAPLDGAPGDAAACVTTTEAFPLAAGTHVPVCSGVTYPTNPPTSGAHYPVWAKYQAYSAPVSRPFWVHDLEHGAVVVSYNCPAGCDAEVAALIAYLDARPADPLCTAPVRNRFVVTPDPLLDTTFAASAWGFALRSTCFDLPALGAFIDAHYAHAPENLCADGVDVLDPASGIPPNCP
ncbi:MAG: DUF3105 domain-containing protein [Deltaproteobacteria bacterium]|nr:DUF3105 domain-containing protein [Deltaproteobacteria bacterium]